MNNQAGIAGSLANLYAYRAAIIEKGRNDALYWVQWATESLDQTKLEVTDYTHGWKAVQGFGAGTTAVAAWTGLGAVAGPTITLVGFLGEKVFSGPTTEVPQHDLVEVIKTLNQKLSILSLGAIRGLEDDYYSTVNRLHSLIYQTHSYNLELYDFRQNRPDGDPDIDDAGYQANVDTILRIAEGCYELAELYETLLPIIARTAVADGHLANKDGNPTRADNRLLELRDLLESFLKTSCGRYLLAGDQVKDAAKRYVEQDEAQQQRFGQMVSQLGHEVSIDPDGYAEETERPGRPGSNDDSVDYQVEGGE